MEEKTAVHKDRQMSRQRGSRKASRKGGNVLYYFRHFKLKKLCLRVPGKP